MYKQQEGRNNELVTMYCCDECKSRDENKYERYDKLLAEQTEIRNI